MELLTSVFSISLAAILTNNFVLSQFLGICPFMGVSKKIDTALGMGAAVTFVMGLASLVTYFIQHLLLEPLRKLVRQGAFDKIHAAHIVRAALGNDAGIVGAAMLCRGE